MAYTEVISAQGLLNHPETAEKYPGWNGLPLTGEKPINLLLVGLRHHIDDFEFSLLNVGDLVFLQREPNNPVDKNAIAAFMGNKLIGYIKREDIPLLDIAVPKEYAVACYITKILDTTIVVEIPSKDKQDMAYMQYALDRVPKDIDLSKCPNVNFEISCEEGDRELMAEFRDALSEFKKNGFLYYFVMPNGEGCAVSCARHFGNSFHFDLEHEIISRYMTDEPNAFLINVQEIDESTNTMKLLGIIYKEHDESIVEFKTETHHESPIAINAEEFKWYDNQYRKTHTMADFQEEYKLDIETFHDLDTFHDDNYYYFYLLVYDFFNTPKPSKDELKNTDFYLCRPKNDSIELYQPGNKNITFSANIDHETKRYDDDYDIAQASNKLVEYAISNPEKCIVRLIDYTDLHIMSSRICKMIFRFAIPISTEMIEFFSSAEDDYYDESSIYEDDDYDFYSSDYDY